MGLKKVTNKCRQKQTVPVPTDTRREHLPNTNNKQYPLSQFTLPAQTMFTQFVP